MSKRNQGIMLAITGTMFWGISSPVAQALFAQNVKPLWLVGARLLLAGILLSVWGFIATDKEQHKEIFKKKNLILQQKQNGPRNLFGFWENCLSKI